MSLPRLPAFLLPVLFCPLLAAKTIVSMNLCIDQVLPYIAMPGSNLHLTHLSKDPRYSTLPDSWLESASFHRGSVEEIIANKPDIILATEFDNPGTLAMLGKSGHQVSVISLPSRIEDIGSFLDAVASAAGLPAPDTMEFEQALQDYRDIMPPGKTATLFEPNGFGPGANPYKSNVMLYTGLEVDQRGTVTINLEALVAGNYDVIVLNHGGGGGRSLSDSLFTRHPVINEISQYSAIREVESSSWLCPGPQVTSALKQITGVD